VDPSRPASSDHAARGLAEALDAELPLHLPACADPVTAAAADYTRAHLGQVTVGDVTRAVAISERTLRRLFRNHLGMSWRTYLLRARVLRAIALLARPELSVLDVSIAVGFDDASAFARSFARHCGETPSAYRRRISGASPAEAAAASAGGGRQPWTGR
jgi:transcriptional regulator GlxA family with amidase domain